MDYDAAQRLLSEHINDPCVKATFTAEVGLFSRRVMRNGLTRLQFRRPAVEISWVETSTFLSSEFVIRIEGPAKEVRKALEDLKSLET